MFYLRLSLLLTVFLIPFIGFSQNSFFEETKVLAFLALTTLSGFIWTFKLARNGKKLGWSSIKISSLIFILGLLITSILGLDPKASFLGRDPYYQGWILYSYLYLFFLMVSSSQINLLSWAKVLCISSILVSALAIEDFSLMKVFHFHMLNYAGRVISTFGQPNFYGGFLLLDLPFGYFLSGKKGALGWIGKLSLVLSALAIVVSFSRIGIALLLTVSLGIGGFYLGKLKLIIVLFFIILIGAFYLSYRLQSGIVEDEIQRPLNAPRLEDSVEKRFFILPVVWDGFLKRPIFGYGLENLNLAWSSYKKINEQRSPAYYELKDLVVDRSHNYPLDLLVFSGVGGLITWLTLTFILIIKAKSKLLLISLILYLVWVQFQNQSVVHLIYFWLIAGLIDQ